DDGSSFGLYKHEGRVESRNGSAMFRVDDVAEAARHLQELGGLIPHGEDLYGDFPTCHMAFGKDPEDNQFIIHKRKE
ncbi:MAG TPA: hypothetical protein VKT72_09160, partial [Candidatus Baltobacteraceae bacterium]|nr:hypothetical protein [Candidatus Baltobacteraceae bacterium]